MVLLRVLDERAHQLLPRRLDNHGQNAGPKGDGEAAAFANVRV
jgi:hypothetical protein